MSYRDIFSIDISNGVDFVAVKASQFNKLKLREEYPELQQREQRTLNQ
jgi:hypothetical protein